jgi:hypothetical protein
MEVLNSRVFAGQSDEPILLVDESDKGYERRLRTTVVEFRAVIIDSKTDSSFLGVSTGKKDFSRQHTDAFIFFSRE